MLKLLATGARIQQGAGALTLFLVGFAVWWVNTSNLTIRLAWDGFSPNLLVAEYLHPEWFVGNFPSGTEELLKSAPMAIYLLGAWLGISAIHVMTVLIAIEILLLVAVALWSTRRFFPEAGPVAPILVATLVIAGTLRMPDLGRFGDPFYGWVYSYAEAAIVLAVAAALEKRLFLSALAFALAFVCHPVLALIGCIFGVAVLLADWQNLDTRQLAAALALFLAIAGPWFWYLASSSGLGGGGIPNEIYVAFTRMESSHWYPVDLGLFWERHWERLFPFLTECLLLFVYLPDEEGRFSGGKAQMAVGFAAMLALTAIGIAISAWFPDPFLVKLAFQRASSIFLLMGTFYIVPGLWRDAVGGSIPRAIIAILVFISCFVTADGIPVVYGLGMAAITVVEDIRMRGWTGRARLASATALLLMALWILYASVGVVDWANPQYWGLSMISMPRLAIILALTALVVATRRFESFAAITLLLAIGVLGVFWARAGDQLSRYPRQLADEEDYLAAQLWAKNNTPLNALFMPDPTHYYGWSDFALRPSFGNLHEWLYSGWIYNSRKSVFDEGVKRVRAFGIDPFRYLAIKGRPPGSGDKLTTDLRRRYYSLTSQDLAHLSANFGISYFIFERDIRKSALRGCNVAYRNSHYLIVNACRLSAS